MLHLCIMQHIHLAMFFFTCTGECPICSEPVDFILDGCGCAVCIDCLRKHATSELELRPGQRPRCPQCMIPDGSAAAAAGPSRPGLSRSDSAGVISWQQLEFLLDGRQLLLLHAAQV